MRSSSSRRKWKDANTNDTTTVEQALVQEDENGLKKWENYVLGIEETAEAPAIEAAAAETKDEAKIDMSFTPKAAADTGIKVAYKLDTVKVDGDTGVATTNRADTATSTPIVPLSDLAAGKSKYVTVRAVLTSAAGVETEVEVNKVVGVLTVNSTLQNTIVAVSWHSFSGSSITANELVYTGNRKAGDTLTVYVPATGTYKSWTLDADGGSWASVTTYSQGANGDKTNQQSGNAIDQTIPRGAGVWVFRKDVNEKIYLLGQKPETAAKATVKKGYNLVAPVPTEEDTEKTEIEIDKVVGGDSTSTDKILVPPSENSAPIALDCKVNEGTGKLEWGYDYMETYITESGKKRTRKVRMTNVKVPSGTGFWYISNSNGQKEVSM